MLCRLFSLSLLHSWIFQAPLRTRRVIINNPITTKYWTENQQKNRNDENIIYIYISKAFSSLHSHRTTLKVDRIKKSNNDIQRVSIKSNYILCDIESLLLKVDLFYHGMSYDTNYCRTIVLAPIPFSTFWTTARNNGQCPLDTHNMDSWTRFVFRM